jgi:hypothetical protein
MAECIGVATRGSLSARELAGAASCACGVRARPDGRCERASAARAARAGGLFRGPIQKMIDAPSIAGCTIESTRRCCQGLCLKIEDVIAALRTPEGAAHAGIRASKQRCPWAQRPTRRGKRAIRSAQSGTSLRLRAEARRHGIIKAAPLINYLSRNKGPLGAPPGGLLFYSSYPKNS